ncbi:hypothetical protein [Pantoea sp. FN0305]|uniref:hypothetical protein n=1 Tax=Pantoea sp. FN0305 TaxID=3418559 RepID=UPI003CF82431
MDLNNVRYSAKITEYRVVSPHDVFFVCEILKPIHSAEEKMTYSQLAKIYGYDPVTVSRDWTSRGLDISLSDDEIYQWVADNVLTPLRGQTDLKTETQIEQLRLAKAKADIEEMEADLKRKNLVEVDYVTETLSGYFNQLKNMLRSIPNTTYIELFSSEDANQLREKLKDKIDEVLRDIGSYEYEEETENGFSESEETDQDTEQSSEGDITARENKTE